VPGYRLGLVAAAGLVAAVAATVLAVALNVATGGTARWFPTMEGYPLWWTVGATVAVAGAGLVMWRVQGWYDRGLTELIPAVQRPEPWVVDRPAEVNQIIAALRSKRGGTVGITTAVHGAGGFGKTTVAKLVRADQRTLRRFRGRVYWVTLGRDAGKQALAGLVNGLIAQIQPERAVTFTDAGQAGDHLAAVLAKGPRRLLILDDVWSRDQLAVFRVAGRCVRLVTTRNASLAAGTRMPVKVDQMSQAQARALLLAGLPPLATVITEGFIEETGRWPLLLRLVNKILADQLRFQPDITEAAETLLDRLRTGVLQVDQLTEAAGQHLDVTDPDQRNKAVRATIQASTSLLLPAEHDRFVELGVFAEDETIAVRLVALLWQATGTLDQIAVRALCTRLADLGLVTLIRTSDGGAIEVHDVIREFLLEELGHDHLVQLHQVLLDTAAELASVAASGNRAARTVTPWWELPESARYLREHLIEHMLAAGRFDEAEITATDLRWAGTRLEHAGPAGPAADLALIGTPQAERMRSLISKSAELLAPVHPMHSLFDIMRSRVSHDPDWGPQARALQGSRLHPELSNLWPLPDLPDPSLTQAVTGYAGKVIAIAIAPDGTWIAIAGGDRTARILDIHTGRQRAVLTAHTDLVRVLAIAADSTWLATAGDDGTARIWDAVTGRQRAVLDRHSRAVTSVAIAPDGTWLATAGDDGTARIWDAVTGRQRAVLDRHSRAVTSVAIAPDGTWLATAGDDGTARIWDAVTGRQRAVLDRHSRAVTSVAIAPDGTWLATTSRDRTARIWDPIAGRQRAVLINHADMVLEAAIAPDGTWLATGGWDRAARIWDAAGRQRAILAGHSSWVTAVAIAPDSTWLATASDMTGWMWDSQTGRQRTVLNGHTGLVTAMAIAPDGAWLATVSWDGTLRIWDSASGEIAVVMRVNSRLQDCEWHPSAQSLVVAGDRGIYYFAFKPSIT
jgi:WD40 repeat protein